MKNHESKVSLLIRSVVISRTDPAAANATLFANAASPRHSVHAEVSAGPLIQWSEENPPKDDKSKSGQLIKGVQTVKASVIAVTVTTILQ